MSYIRLTFRNGVAFMNISSKDLPHDAERNFARSGL